MSAGNMEDIAAVIETMKFRRKFFGGVDEMDVWKQLENLQREYRSAYEKQEERLAALIRERNVELEWIRKRGGEG